MKIVMTMASMVILAATMSAQSFQPNTATHALQFNAPALTAVGQPVPIVQRVFTGDVVSVNLQGGTDAMGNAAQPFALLFSPSNTPGSSISIQTFFAGGIRLDIVDVGAPGYFDQIAIDGFTNPGFGTMDAMGQFSFNVALPNCIQDPSASLCTMAAYTEVSLQAVVTDITQLPLGLASTGAGTVEVVDGFQEFFFTAPTNDPFGTFNFRDGFSFDFYGNTYTSAFVSENGYVQFGTTASLSTFPSPSVTSILGGGPRIMCFFNDLVYGGSGGLTPRIYAEQFTDNGARKLRFVYENIQEFGNATGPHGGQITICESGDIAVFVDPSNAQPSINTGVGISPGSGFPQSGDPGFSPASGRNLSTEIGTGLALGANRAAFELFQAFPFPGTPLDLIGLDTMSPVGPGFVLTPNPAVSPFTAGYIIQ